MQNILIVSSDSPKIEIRRRLPDISEARQLTFATILTPYMVVISPKMWLSHKSAFLFFINDEFAGELAINDLGDDWNEIGPFIVFPKFRKIFFRFQNEIFESIVQKHLEEFRAMKFVWSSHNPAALRFAFKIMDKYFKVEGKYKLNYRPPALKRFEYRLAASPWFIFALLQKGVLYILRRLDKSSSRKEPPTSFAYDPDGFADWKKAPK